MSNEVINLNKLPLFFFRLKEKLAAFQERVVDEKKKRLEDRKRQRKDDRRTAYYRQKEEEAQRIHEESLKKGERPAPPTAPCRPLGITHLTGERPSSGRSRGC